MASYSATKDADAVLPYGISWANWLGTDTIAASTWTVTGPDSDLTIDHTEFSDTVTLVWLSGGTSGGKYVLTNHITTLGTGLFEPLQDDRSIEMKIVEK